MKLIRPKLDRSLGHSGRTRRWKPGLTSGGHPPPVTRPSMITEPLIVVPQLKWGIKPRYRIVVGLDVTNGYKNLAECLPFKVCDIY